MDIYQIISKYEFKRENLLKILHEVQTTSGNNFISDESIKIISRELKLTYSHVYGVVTYYSMFSVVKRGKNIIRVCCSPVCDLKNSIDIIIELENCLKIKCGETTSDHLFTLEKSECLGLCDQSPAMMINDKEYGHLNSDQIKKIISELTI